MIYSVTIGLDAEDHEHLMRPINGKGGFQSFLAQLQNSIEEYGEGWCLTLTGEQVLKLGRYAWDYGDGGYEKRLQKIQESCAAFF